MLTSSITAPGVITSGLTITEHPADKAVDIFLEASVIGKFKVLMLQQHQLVDNIHVF